MMTLDECIAAARLPIRVEFAPIDNLFWLQDKSKWWTGFTTTEDVRKKYVALRTRLSEQQGEK